ncbi:MAG: phosphoglycerate kinase [Thaumarchaeota archaeon]|nr:phosphoglycerate kinase [Nitrososphaerota archaeon]
MPAKILTMDNLELDGKRVFTRVDINTPINPETGELLELSRIEEAAITIRDLSASTVIIASHQGRVGRYDYISMEKHAKALGRVLGKEVGFVEDVFGEAAKSAIDRSKPGDVLVLDNLRFTAEENMEFSVADAQKTILVTRLRPHVDACVLDAFPTGHRAHPSIVGFAELVPTCAGRVVARELMKLERIAAIEKGPYVTVLGGAKVNDRIEAIDALIANQRADKVLLSGLVALVFLKSKGKYRGALHVENEQKMLLKARQLLDDHAENFELPVDVAIRVDGTRKEMDIADVQSSAAVLDIGTKTIDRYSRFIKGAGTVFMSGPPGAFEYEEFGLGTEMLLKAMKNSFGTTIVSGGHLTAALYRFGIHESIDHVSTAGGALVQYLAGKRLPLMDALERSAAKWGQ